MIVGLTGTIGSGKSTFANMLAKRGAHIIDADILAREVLAPGTSGLQEVIECFGSDILTSDKELNRKKLGSIIFSDRTKRAQLEKITHPKIQQLYQERLRALKGRVTPIVAVIPLLFESENQHDELERIIVVIADLNTRLERIQARDTCSLAAAQQKIASQMPQEEKMRYADYIVDNSADLDSLEQQAEKIYAEILDER